MRAWILAAALVLVAGAASAADCSRPTPVVFEPGSSSVTIANQESSSADCYQLTARGSQHLTITVDNAADDAVLALYAPGWAVKCDRDGACDLTGDLLSEDDTKTWSDIVEAAGAYLIVVDNSKSGADYELTVEMQ
ncbi:MAG TPA: hypothetical protein VGG57_15655 [Stellaceae bacterium]